MFIDRLLKLSWCVFKRWVEVEREKPKNFWPTPAFYTKLKAINSILTWYTTSEHLEIGFYILKNNFYPQDSVTERNNIFLIHNFETVPTYAQSILIKSTFGLAISIQNLLKIVRRHCKRNWEADMNHKWHFHSLTSQNLKFQNLTRKNQPKTPINRKKSKRNNLGEY